MGDKALGLDWFAVAKDICNPLTVYEKIERAPTMYDKLNVARDDVMARIADRLGKPRADLVAWVDYDPTQVDEDIQRLAKGPYRYAGD